MRTVDSPGEPGPADVVLGDWTQGALRVDQAVTHSGVSRAELYRRMDAGALAYTKLGRSRLISRASLARMLAHGDPRSSRGAR